MTENPATVTCDEAYSATDTLLIKIEGLIHAAFILADEHPALGAPGRETAALHVVLGTLRDSNDPLREARSAEYRAGLALEKASKASG